MKNKKLHKLLVSLFALFLTTTAWGAVTYSITGTGSNLTLTISGPGAMDDYSSGNAPWYSSRSNIKTIIIEDGVTRVGAYAFEGITYSSITIPTSVKSFGIRAFNSISSGSSRKVYYKGTPNDWAGIDFKMADGASYPSSHPFYNNLSANNHIYFYNQTTTETTNIVFTPGLTTIQPYVFWYAGNITNVNIPNSVTTIGKQAFWYCASLCRIFVNNTTAPTASADAFEHMTSGVSASWLYLPNGANSGTGDGGFKKLPWYDSNYSGKGPARIGYEGTDASGVSAVSSFGLYNSKVYPRTGTVDGITWTLDDDGVMTFSGSGAITTTFVENTGNANLYPWWRFHDLVDKVVVTGGVTGLSNALARFDALREIDIQQAIIPTASASLPTYIHCGVVPVLIKPSALSNNTNASNLESAPWTNVKIGNISLSEPAVFGDQEENTNLLSNINAYVDEPFDLTLNRSLSNSYNNTFCSPVTLTKAQVKEIWGDDTEVYAMTGTSINEDGEIELTFEEIDTNDLEAGKPYLVWPENNVASPVIENVNPSSIAVSGGTVNTVYMTFTGILAPKAITEDEVNNQSIIFLTTSFSDSENQILTWANGGTLKGQRAYWQFKESTPASAMARRPILKFSDENNTATGIDLVTDNPSPAALKQLRDGQLIIIKNGKTYNAQGAYLR